MSLEQEALQGEVAGRILADETIMKIFSEIRQTLLEDIALTQRGEAETREELYSEIRGIESLLTRLKAVADSGTYARSRLQRS